MRYHFIKLSLILISFFYSCLNNNYVNDALTKVGAYDEKVTLRHYKSNTKEIILIPMVHISTPNFYQDVKNKVDSLRAIDFVFHYELINSPTDSIQKIISVKKCRKITNIYLDTLGYVGIMKKKLGADFVPFKPIISQPKYEKLNIDIINDINSDLSMEQILEKYEQKYGEVRLENCDLIAPLDQATTCKKYKITKQQKEDFSENFRNEKIIEDIKNSKNAKIALIYGKQHFTVIEKWLAENGYTKISTNSTQ